MVERLLVEIDKFSVFPYYGLEKGTKAIVFDIKCHDSYLMKCLHNDITQNDTIWWHLYLPHLVSNVKVNKGAKIRNRYNQVPHLTQDTNGKVTNHSKTPQTRAKRSAFSQQVTTKHI